jgi:hypothetical protein
MTYRPNDTQVYKRVARVRSRHMIPMEMLAFVTLLIAGAAGAFGDGWLHYQLKLNGKALEWGLALIPIAATGTFFSAFEWWLGVDWENGRLRHSIWIRTWCSGLAFVMWFYVLYVMADLQQGAISSMVWTACAVMPFHVWSWWVNYRVHCALHPAMRTEKLGARLETNRDRW